jgi:1,4-alpha-glucan branching enzyme
MATAGRVQVRIPVADAPASDVFIAGSFNGWQPLPMHREGDSWVVELTLPSGVYDYAFRSADGKWFVPASTAGRRSDGMGGYVARLVVA